jgi:hypothetical protein
MGNNSDAAQGKKSLITCSTALINKGKQWMNLVFEGRRRDPALPLNSSQGATQRLQQQHLVHTRLGDLLMMCLQNGKHDKQLYQESLYGHGVDNDEDLFLFLQQVSLSHQNRLARLISLRKISKLKIVSVRRVNPSLWFHNKANASQTHSSGFQWMVIRSSLTFLAQV